MLLFWSIYHILLKIVFFSPLGYLVYYLIITQKILHCGEYQFLLQPLQAALLGFLLKGVSLEVLSQLNRLAFGKEAPFSFQS